MQKRILVTGGSGYIGSHTIIDLIEHGYDVVSIDNGINSDIDMLTKVEEITGYSIFNHNINLCDYESTLEVFSEKRIDGVIHFAALKSVKESTDDPLFYFHNNNTALNNVMMAMVETGVRHIIFSSSCTVYGNTSSSPVDESAPQMPPESPYGRTKQIGEGMVLDACKFLDIQGIMLRYFNPAGAHISGLIGEHPIVEALNLVPAITETAIGKRKSITVYGSDYETRDGSCVRDYIHVMDLAHAHTLALQYLMSGKQSKDCDIINLGIGEGVTVLEMINAFEKVSGTKLNYTIGPRRPGDVEAIYADNTKARNLLGWVPKYDVTDIMKTAWSWEQYKATHLSN